MTAVGVGYATDTGLVRDHNEDCLLSRPQDGLWIVADGMGGYAAGEVASGLVIEQTQAMLDQGRELSEALVECNKRIFRAIEEGDGGPGMGSTVVALQLIGCSYKICWVGDSRAYLFDGTSLQQLTRDHSHVQLMVDSGLISSEEAKDHPLRNVITQALGSKSIEVRVETVTGNLFRGDRLLLCSDGLTSELSDDVIASILDWSGSCQEKVDRLVAAAKEMGGHDNITAILVEAPDNGPIRPAGDSTSSEWANGDYAIFARNQRYKTGKFIFPVLLGIVVAVVIALFFIRS